MLKEGLCWRVENGESVNTWHDSWLIDENGMGVTTTIDDNDPDMRVCDLIDASSSGIFYGGCILRRCQQGHPPFSPYIRHRHLPEMIWIILSEG